MLRGKPTLLVDQFGMHVWACTLKELHEKVSGVISRMYVDTKDGRTLHIGYVVGNRWFTAFQRCEKEV